MNKSNGFTLLELMFTSTIAVSLLAVAIPGFKHLSKSTTLTSETMQLFSAIKYAREKSISWQKNLILCGTKNQFDCSDDWSKGHILFIDENNNDQFDPVVDDLIKSHVVDEENLIINWRSFRGKKPIRFIPAGITWHFNGTFTLCLDKSPNYSKAIFLAKTGRVEISEDRNNDGIDELRNGKPVKCR